MEDDDNAGPYAGEYDPSLLFCDFYPHGSVFSDPEGSHSPGTYTVLRSVPALQMGGKTDWMEPSAAAVPALAGTVLVSAVSDYGQRAFLSLR